MGKIFIPCDCFALSGSLIANESLITGESTPKSHLPKKNINFNYDKNNKYIFVAGAKIF